MALYYALADVALIGGSLMPLGGQNLIEACACGCPIVLGPHMFNFAQAAADAVATGAARFVGDAGQALAAMDQISASTALRARMAEAAVAFAAAHRGATERTVALLGQVLEQGQA
jgi:3-deoxy-D-manno-octulosonic-acid transferase